MPNFIVRIDAYDHNLKVEIKVREDHTCHIYAGNKELFLNAVGQAYDKIMAEIEKLSHAQPDQLCEECKRRIATSKYGELKTCDYCNDKLNNEFDEEYR